MIEAFKVLISRNKVNFIHKTNAVTWGIRRSNGRHPDGHARMVGLGDQDRRLGYCIPNLAYRPGRFSRGRQEELKSVAGLGRRH